jgi:FkbM family methyltransferase
VNFFSSIAQSLLFAVYPRRFNKKFLHYIGRASASPFLFRGTYGLFYLLRARDAVDNGIVRGGIHEAENIATILEQVRKSQANLFLDIGSNLGCYALAVAKETDCRQIIAFEPDPFNRAHLYANIFLNGLEDRIRVFSEAASDTKGEAHFYAARKTKRTHKENTGASSLEPPAPDRVEAGRVQMMQVQTERLDNLLGSVVGQVIVVKMDVEGHESKALEGMENLINNNQIWLQIEIWPNVAERTRAVLQKLGLIELPQTLPGSCDFIFTSSRAP